MKERADVEMRKNDQENWEIENRLLRETSFLRHLVDTRP